VNCAEITGDRPRQPAYEIKFKLMLSRLMGISSDFLLQLLKSEDWSLKRLPSEKLGEFLSSIFSRSLLAHKHQKQALKTGKLLPVITINNNSRYCIQQTEQH